VLVTIEYGVKPKNIQILLAIFTIILLFKVVRALFLCLFPWWPGRIVEPADRPPAAGQK